MEPKQTQFKLTEEDRAIIKRLSDKLGITNTDVVRISIRRMETLEGVVDKVKLPRYKKEG